ncbi:MAG: nucleotidyltransferase family protein [Phycisphaerales bacterium]|nr:nucleotidyltransferase family protein [Phycisphaerales bacterium]
MTDATPARVFGLIPAAGASRRMGTPKQLLAWGNSTILETVIDTILAGGVDGLAVVTNPHVADALKLHEASRHLTVILDDPDAEMLESILAGAETLRAMCAATSRDAFLVCPGDLPRMSSDIVHQCVDAYAHNPGRIVAAYASERYRHPLLIPFSLLSVLNDLRGIGLVGVLKRHDDQIVRVAIADETCLRDVDTPDDYDAMR